MNRVGSVVVIKGKDAGKIARHKRAWEQKRLENQRTGNVIVMQKCETCSLIVYIILDKPLHSACSFLI